MCVYSAASASLHTQTLVNTLIISSSHVSAAPDSETRFPGAAADLAHTAVRHKTVRLAQSFESTRCTEALSAASLVHLCRLTARAIDEQRFLASERQ